jgi:hypothetical protein
MGHRGELAGGGRRDARPTGDQEAVQFAVGGHETVLRQAVHADHAGADERQHRSDGHGQADGRGHRPAGPLGVAAGLDDVRGTLAVDLHDVAGDEDAGSAVIGDRDRIHTAGADGQETGAVVARVGLVHALCGIGPRPVDDVPRGTQPVEPGERSSAGGLQPAGVTLRAAAPGPLDGTLSGCLDDRGRRRPAGPVDR